MGKNPEIPGRIAIKNCDNEDSTMNLLMFDSTGSTRLLSLVNAIPYSCNGIPGGIPGFISLEVSLILSNRAIRCIAREQGSKLDIYRERIR